MASGDPVLSFAARDGVPPTSNPAIPDETAANVPCLDFNDGTSESIYFIGIVDPNYDGSSAITVTLMWKFTTFVGSQTCDWEVSFYLVDDDADSVESLSFAAAQAVLATEASAVGELDYATIAFTNAQADGIAANKYVIVRATRDATGGTASPGDAELFALHATVT